MTTKPEPYTEWQAALERQRLASVRYALSETEDNMDAWNDTDADEQDAHDRWSEYADEHELCLSCAEPAFEGYAHCREHVSKDLLIDENGEPVEV